jgi:hypothetical protein
MRAQVEYAVRYSQPPVASHFNQVILDRPYPQARYPNMKQVKLENPKAKTVAYQPRV